MPNFGTHLIGGGLSAAVLGKAAGEAPNESQGQPVVLNVLVGAGAAVLPDILESALKLGPRHRKFFHSVALGALLVWLLVKLLQGQRSGHQAAAGAGCTGYISHLLLDAFTPNGLPTI